MGGFGQASNSAEVKVHSTAEEPPLASSFFLAFSETLEKLFRRNRVCVACFVVLKFKLRASWMLGWWITSPVAKIVCFQLKFSIQYISITALHQLLSDPLHFLPTQLGSYHSHPCSPSVPLSPSISKQKTRQQQQKSHKKIKTNEKKTNKTRKGQNDIKVINILVSLDSVLLHCEEGEVYGVLSG